MAYVRIEPTGCVVRKGMVQIRLCMYLEPSDFNYDKHNVDVRVIPEGEVYLGQLDADSNPVDITHYNNWLLSFPIVKKDNPFHNHFIYVEPDISDDEIMNIAERSLFESYEYWKKGVVPDPNPRSSSVNFRYHKDHDRDAKCVEKVEKVKKIKSVRFLGDA